MPDKIISPKPLSELDLEAPDDIELMERIIREFDDYPEEDRIQLLRDKVEQTGFQTRKDHDTELTIYDYGGIKAKTKDTPEDEYVDNVLSMRNDDAAKSNAREVFTIERLLLFLCPDAFIEIRQGEDQI